MKFESVIAEWYPCDGEVSESSALLLDIIVQDLSYMKTSE